MFNQTQISNIPLLDIAWDIHELDPIGPATNPGERYIEPFKKRLKNFLAKYEKNEVRLDAEAPLANFLQDVGIGYLMEGRAGRIFQVWVAPTDVIRFILTFYERGGFAGLDLKTYVKEMFSEHQSS